MMLCTLYLSKTVVARTFTYSEGSLAVSSKSCVTYHADPGVSNETPFWIMSKDLINNLAN